MATSLRYKFWCWRKYFAESEIRLAAKLSRSGTVCLDVGANAGAYTYFMCRSGASVHSFEPIPELAAKLRQRFDGQITLHSCAVSDHAGITEIRAPLINGEPAYGLASIEQAWPDSQLVRHQVDIETLDSFDFKNVSLIKIDIEGHELAALKGATQTLSNNRPHLIIESEERHRMNAVADISKFLKALDYRGWFKQDGQIYNILEFSVDRHQKTFGDKNYVFNFVFSPKEAVQPIW